MNWGIYCCAMPRPFKRGWVRLGAGGGGGKKKSVHVLITVSDRCSRAECELAKAAARRLIQAVIERDALLGKKCK
jgi:hypothetical protein